MGDKFLDVVQPEEVEYFIQSLRKFQLKDIGSNVWLDGHEIVLKLSQQAGLEASAYREETVKELLILHSKLKVLVHEAYCILLWKTKVLPELLRIDPNPQASFLIYTTFFHEASVIALLELALYHQNGCKSLEENSIDLIDYSCQAITQLIGLVRDGFHENGSEANIDEAGLAELERQKRNLVFKIGMRCLSILSYLVDNLESLPLSAGKRLVATHDTPCLLSEILHARPWLRKTKKGFEKFIDDKWTTVVGDKLLQVTKTEAQTWFCFRAIILNNDLMRNYPINDFRQRELAKCQGLLNDVILDQLPPLIELKHFLCTLTISQNSSARNCSSLLFEELPLITEKLLQHAKNDGGYVKLAKIQSDIFLNSNKNEISDIAKRLNAAYNTDLLAELEEKQKEIEKPNNEDQKCANCKKGAEKRCANCMNVFYCSRECQKTDWTTHKVSCMQSLN